MKKYLILFIAILIIPISFIIAGCTQGETAVHVTGFRLRYQDNVYSFNAEDDNYLEFHFGTEEDVNFEAEEFELLIYRDEELIQTISHEEFLFEVRDTQGWILVDGHHLTEGYYQLYFEYEDWFGAINVNITDTILE